MNRARHGATLLLSAGLFLALASALAACGGAADGDPPTTEAPPTPAVTPEPPAAPVEATAPDASTPTATTTPATPAETAPTPRVTPDPQVPAPEPPVAPAEPPAPEASPPPAESASPATRAPEPTAAPGEPSTPTAEIPAPEAEPLPLLYDTYDLSGAVAEPGHYTFLEDPDDPSTVVTTYEGLRDGTATALLVHTHDAHGIPQAELYDAVEPGDLFEWKQADDCFVRYTVTSAPAPAADAMARAFGVAWMTYAFTGCSGPIPAGTGAGLGLGDLPNLGGTSLATPIRHGILQIIPANWTGAIDPGEREGYMLPDGAPAYPGPYAETRELRDARGFPYWREPALPAGWTFNHAFTGGTLVTYGYCASYAAADGFLNVEVCGEALLGPSTRAVDASWLTDAGSYGMRAGVRETRVIAGRPAVVQYSPEGPHHYAASSMRVYVHDVATQSMYTVIGIDPGLRGANVDALIAIARSLFEHPPSLLYDTYDLTGAVAEPGHYTFLADPNDPASVVTTYEGLRDGTAMALLVHTHDAHGIPRAELYDAVEPGDLFEWKQADDCFVRYMVTETPAPAAGATARKFGVARMTYAFTGCSGAVATGTAATLDWADLPDLGGTSLTVPVVHGAFQIVPAGWEGVVEETFLQPPPQATRDTLETIQTTWMAPAGTLARAAELPYWRTPALPDTWTFTGAGLSRDVVPYGYIAEWTGPGGSGHLTIDGTHAEIRRWPHEASRTLAVTDELFVKETRIIAGRPAYVSYTPAPNGQFASIRIYIYDPATEAQYRLAGIVGGVALPDVASVIAIARSLFEPPNAP